jgi:hypothetical protein
MLMGTPPIHGFSDYIWLVIALALWTAIACLFYGAMIGGPQ